MHKFLINAPAHTGHKQELRLKVPGIQRNEESEGRQTNVVKGPMSR